MLFRSLDNIIIDSKSGYSGAGRGVHKKYKDKNLYESLSAYGVGFHRHNSEIHQFLSKFTNKNFQFMVDVLKKYDDEINVTIINPPENIPGFNCVYTETNNQALKELSENDIYFHASDYETVGLPLYEAQNLGLKLVIPQKPYTTYFNGESVFIYEHKNLKSALLKIKEANNLKIKNSKALIYNENWSKILKYI